MDSTPPPHGPVLIGLRDSQIESILCAKVKKTSERKQKREIKRTKITTNTIKTVEIVWNGTNWKTCEAIRTQIALEKKIVSSSRVNFWNRVTDPGWADRIRDRPSTLIILGVNWSWVVTSKNNRIFLIYNWCTKISTCRIERCPVGVVKDHTSRFNTNK